MITPANIGVVVAVLSVIAAYWLGYSNGHSVGQQRGYGDGKREGSKEGSMRGYAVGYDRAKRQAGRSGDDDTGDSRLRFGLVASVLAVALVFFLAASASKWKARRSLSTPDRPAELTNDRLSPQSAPGSLVNRELEAVDRSVDARPQRDQWETREDTIDTRPVWSVPATSVHKR